MSAAVEKQKRIEAEAVARIARVCLERIALGHSRNPEKDADEALGEMFRVGRKQPLQGLVGHERRPR